jgi:hypothetical protein
MAIYLHRILWVAATGVLVVAAGIWGLQAVYMLLRTHAVLGAVSSEAREGIRNLLDVSRQGATLKHSRTVLLYLGLGSLVVFVFTREWLALVVAATPFVLMSWIRIRTTTPPVVLLLGTSTHTAVQLQRNIKRRVAPLRVVSLLDMDFPWDRDLANEMSLDCFRTTNAADWWAVVVTLIQSSPIIAIDAAANTVGVIREGEHLLGSGLFRKCLFLTPPDGFAPILDRLLPESHLKRHDLHIVSYEEAPGAVAGMLAELGRMQASRAGKTKAISTPSGAESRKYRDHDRPQFMRNPYKMIMMNCPVTGKPVETGINSAYFEEWGGNPPPGGASFKCPQCDQEHRFDKTNTWLEALK